MYDSSVIFSKGNLNILKCLVISTFWIIYSMHRISANSFRGNYSFLEVRVRQVFKGGNYCVFFFYFLYIHMYYKNAKEKKENQKILLFFEQIQAN